MGIRGISRVTKVSQTTILNSIQEAGESLEDEPQDEEIPEITEIDGEVPRHVDNSPNIRRQQKEQILGLDCCQP